MNNALEQMITECAGDEEALGTRIAGVLEFLTLRAVADDPYYIFTDNEDAMTLVAAGPVVEIIKEALSDVSIKRWEDPMEGEEDFFSDQDPGDERDEPASESE